MTTPAKLLPLQSTRAPDLPITPVEYSQTFQDQLSNALRQYFAQIDSFTRGSNNNFDITYRSVKVVSASYIMSASDSVLLVNAPTSVKINLPINNLTGNTVTIKDSAGNFATHNCTVVGTIDNATNLTMNVNYESRTFIYNGISWNIIGS